MRAEFELTLDVMQCNDITLLGDGIRRQMEFKSRLNRDRRFPYQLVIRTRL